MKFWQDERGSAAKGITLLALGVGMVALVAWQGGRQSRESGQPTQITDTAATAPDGITRTQETVASSCHSNAIAKLVHAGFGCTPRVDDDSVVFLRGSDERR